MLSSMIFSIASLILSFLDLNNHKLLKQLDLLLSYRFSGCHTTWKMFGISFFGQRIFVTERERAIIGLGRKLWADNAYMSLLLRYGILVFVGFTVLYMMTMLYFYRKGNDAIVLIFFLYAMYGLMEPAMYSLTHNIFLLAMASMVYQRSVSIHNEQQVRRVRFVARFKGGMYGYNRL